MGLGAAVAGAHSGRAPRGPGGLDPASPENAYWGCGQGARACTARSFRAAPTEVCRSGWTPSRSAALYRRSPQKR